ncbi:TPA: FAD-dependent thymidylate synthase [Serratia marcescens]|nr:FAD-dependent thymidylate synthase [Serratia marcescens]
MNLNNFYCRGVNMHISELKVRCLSKPNFNLSEFLKFLADENLDWHRTSSSTPAEELVEVAGRICYMSFGEGKQSPRRNNEYIDNLIRQGHESVLEHVNWSFLMSGVSRAFTHQLVRHRIGFSYSQLSQQYHDESNASFVLPVEIKNNPELCEVWKRNIHNSVAMYKEIMGRVYADDSINGHSKKEILRSLRSASRSILPNATETKIIVTANARAIRHFLIMRGGIDGDHEMRSISYEIYKIVSLDAPALFQDFKVVGLTDGSVKVIRNNGKEKS